MIRKTHTDLQTIYEKYEPTPFDSLPVALRPKRNKERVIPECKQIPHKITKEDDLPETDSGLWLNNFTKISQRIGFRTLFGDFHLFSVPPPAGWLCDWHTKDDGFTDHTYNGVEFPKLGCSVRMERLRVIAWLLSLDDIPKWVPYKNRATTLTKYKKAWKTRAGH